MRSTSPAVPRRLLSIRAISSHTLLPTGCETALPDRWDFFSPGLFDLCRRRNWLHSLCIPHVPGLHRILRTFQVLSCSWDSCITSLLCPDPVFWVLPGGGNAGGPRHVLVRELIASIPQSSAHVWSPGAKVFPSPQSLGTATRCAGIKATTAEDGNLIPIL